ncbi:unnamed protein product [Protopolystoma xenopodis]|uniref:Uncharacterized protein n=1 Tax=Protopolystoma xenopodis TaxID=117903 RepID=A0A3S5AWA6_9PLAT|nr:unnamed protein product [Protopolystoma xenopodis]
MSFWEIDHFYLALLAGPAFETLLDCPFAVSPLLLQASQSRLLAGRNRSGSQYTTFACQPTCRAVPACALCNQPNQQAGGTSLANSCPPCPLSYTPATTATPIEANSAPLNFIPPCLVPSCVEILGGKDLFYAQTCQSPRDSGNLPDPNRTSVYVCICGLVCLAHKTATFGRLGNGGNGMSRALRDAPNNMDLVIGHMSSTL